MDNLTGEAKRDRGRVGGTVSANGYISVLPRLLVWSAQRLEELWVIPWPLWLGGLFPVYLGVIYFILWVRRGSIWPVKCNYPFTERGGPCKNTVTGEWYKCRHHNKVYTYKFGHTVDPKLCRWETFDKGRKIERPVEGVRLFRKRPPKGVLFCYGFARPIWNVPASMWEQARKLVLNLREMTLRTPTGKEAAAALEKRASIEGVDVAEGLQSVARATRFTVSAFLAALFATGIAELLPATPKAMVQWGAILGFVLAWAAISKGVYHRKGDWLGGTCLAALKWWAWAFVPVALIGLIIGP